MNERRTKRNGAGEPVFRIRRRIEQKFALDAAIAEGVSEVVREHLPLDSHAAEHPSSTYAVRSIYFDTDDLRFFFEKVDRVRVRKKLRVRTYDDREAAAPAFLEIKRKEGRSGFKERVVVEPRRLHAALDGGRPIDVLRGGSFWERKLLERFRFNLRAMDLSPTVLIRYDRIAFADPDDDRYRVTLDRNLRSLWNPSLDELFEEEKLIEFAPGLVVLELKFDDQMPPWMTHLVTRFRLRSRPFSKYCRGIHAWEPRAVRHLSADQAAAL